MNPITANSTPANIATPAPAQQPLSLPVGKPNFGMPMQPPQQIQPQNQSGAYRVPGRNVSFSDADLSVLRPVLYGEISNRGLDKKELEARVIANTAFNRMQAYADHGSPKSLSDVLSAPNQYQAYNGSQYHNYNNPNLDAPSAQKRDEVNTVVDKILAEIKSGSFSDNTNGSYFYKHGDGDAIAYDDSRSLFKSNLGKKK